MRLLPWRPGGWTVDDLHLLPRGDGCKYELWDGALWVEPPPPPEHARVIEALTAALTEATADADVDVVPWRPSAPPELIDLDPDLDAETSWVGVGDPGPDGWCVEHIEHVPRAVWLELVEGSIHLLPEPTAEHQAVVRALAARLSAATAQVQAQPDIVLDRRTRLRPDIWVGQAVTSAARLVLEVSEPTTRLVDNLLRPALWSDVGLPHFWRLDLDDMALVTYALEGEAFLETGRFTDEVAVDEPVPLRFRLADLQS